MTDPATLGLAAREALLVALAVSAPVVLAAALAGIVVAALQAATQLQDQTLAHVPRLCAAAVALVVFGPWMARHVVELATRAFVFSR